MHPVLVVFKLIFSQHLITTEFTTKARKQQIHSRLSRFDSAWILNVKTTRYYLSHSSYKSHLNTTSGASLSCGFQVQHYISFINGKVHIHSTNVKFTVGCVDLVSARYWQCYRSHQVQIILTHHQSD